MDPTIRDNPGESPGDIPDRLGPYRVLHMLGRGGMGSVYMAVRDDDSFKRRVAIKVIRKGMDTADVLRRFELERQIVTALNHPNIARVFDAGQTQDGRPYVVMEYIEGLPLDTYCDRNRLSTGERLALFRRVCEAVHSAHQNLIVHRDLKPGNILVTPQGEPKLLDFGIAKILNPELASVTVVTGPEMRVMTPEYASPEQASGEPITTSSDVYSLGVLLYELLTGRMPYSFKTRVRDEVLRVVREVDPEAPSTKVTKAEEVVDDTGTTRTLSAEEFAKSRSNDPQRLRKLLKGDLDNIVLMAMHKSPAKRYRSALALAEDLQRHVEGFPVQARPETFAYSMSRLVRRHRGPVIAGAAVMGVALAGAAGTAWQAGKAREQATIAQQQAKRLEQVREFAGRFLENLQSAIARSEGAGKTRDLLADTSTRILEYLGGEFPDDPRLRFLRAQAWRRVGDVLDGRGANQGRTGDAAEAYAKAWGLLEHNEDGASPAELSGAKGAVLLELARVERRAGRKDLGWARLGEALHWAEQEKGPLLAQVILMRGDWEWAEGRVEEAKRDIEESLAMRRARAGSLPADRESRRALGVGLVRKAEHASPGEATQLFAENLAVREQLAASPEANLTDKRDLATAQKLWGDASVDGGDPRAALPVLQNAMSSLVTLACASPDDARLASDIAFMHESLALAHEALGDVGSAEGEYRAFAGRTGAEAAAHPDNARLKEIADQAQDALSAFLARRRAAGGGGS